MEFQFSSYIELSVRGAIDKHHNHDTQEAVNHVYNEFMKMFGNAIIFQETDDNISQSEFPSTMTVCIQSHCRKIDFSMHLIDAFDVYSQLEEKLPDMHVYIKAPMLIEPVK